MKLAFCLFNYFPYGGLQRDFLKIASSSADRGHEVDVYTMKWAGEKPDFCKIIEIPISSFLLQNHSRAASFARIMQNILKNYDVRIGFNKMPGLDIYYAADTCLKALCKQKKFGKLYQFLPRYKTYLQMEETIFNDKTATKVVYIAQKNYQNYQDHYKLNNKNHFVLPPGLDPVYQTLAKKELVCEKLKKKLGLAGNKIQLLMVASHLQTKGLDRALLALSSLPETLQQQIDFSVIGGKPEKYFRKLTEKLKIKATIFYVEPQNNISEWLQAADLLLHPAYKESAGLILLEAIVAGLPILTTENCGYATHVTDANAGKIIKEPFAQEEFNHQLLTMLSERDQLKIYTKNAENYAEFVDFYTLAPSFISLIEEIGNDNVFSRSKN